MWAAHPCVILARVGEQHGKDSHFGLVAVMTPDIYQLMFMESRPRANTARRMGHSAKSRLGLSFERSALEAVASLQLCGR
jgi:hypothetical protein